MPEDDSNKSFTSSYVILAVFVVVLLYFSHPILIWDKLAIVIRNQGDKQLSRVSLLFSGGNYKWDSMEPHSEMTLVLNDRAKSPLGLIFDASDGIHHEGTLSEYIDSWDLVRAITISVDSENDTTFEVDRGPIDAIVKIFSPRAETTNEIRRKHDEIGKILHVNPSE